MTRVLEIDAAAPDPEKIREAAAVLRQGGLVAFPTETVYGLGARGLHAGEVARIFEAKGRPPKHPVILHVDGEPMARTLSSAWPEAATRLAKEFWPGPLTLVVPRAAIVPPDVSGGLATVGVRAPRHPVALALIAEVGEPLAAPSANAHTHVSPTTAAHVIASLGDRVDVVLDGGPCVHGIESTVLSLAVDPPRVLRPGAVSLERLRAILPVAYEPGIVAAEDELRASPGLASKHYSPRARVELGGEPSAEGAAIVFSSEGRAKAAGLAPLIVLPADPEGYAHGLFAAFYAVDAAGVPTVFVEPVPDDPGWWAVRDRLARAARGG